MVQITRILYTFDTNREKDQRSDHFHIKILREQLVLAIGDLHIPVPDRVKPSSSKAMLCKNAAVFGTIWVCGEVLIDRLPSPIVIDGGKDNRINVVGGGAANTAKCMSRLGYDVQFIDGFSSDKYGALAKTELLEDGVGLDLCVHDSDKPTCLATVNLDENKKASYEFLIEGTATFDFDESWLPNFGAHKPSVLHLGTLATIIEPGASSIFDWATEGAIEHGVPIIFDPNIRPSVMPDRTVYQKAVERFAKISSVIKASDEDVEWLYPHATHEDVARKWLSDECTSLVVITKGENGLTSWTKDGNAMSEAPEKKIEVKDTVGAGDTVGAILTEGLVKHGITKLVKDPECLQYVLRRANKASGITCSREGCKPPTQSDLE